MKHQKLKKKPCYILYTLPIYAHAFVQTALSQF